MNRSRNTLRAAWIAALALLAGLIAQSPSADASPVVPQFVQANTFVDTAAASTLVATFSTPTMAGSLIVATATFDQSALNPVTCTDTQGNTYADAISTYDVAGSQQLSTCYASNTIGGSNTVTVTISNGARPYRGLVISEYSGMAKSNPVEAASGNNGTAGTGADAMTSGSATSASDGDLVYGTFNVFSSSSGVSGGTGFTKRSDVANVFLTEDKVQATAGPATATATTATAGSYISHIVLFRSLGKEESTVVSAVVSPTLTFTVSTHTGACNGVSQTGGSSVSGASVSLGRINASNGVGAQDLIVSTNAVSGFTVFARGVNAQLQRAGGGTLANVTGTNAAPVAFPSVGTEAFGYTTSDVALGTGTANRFTNGGAKWAAISTSNAEVSYNSGVASNDTICIAYQTGAASTTKAGTYSNTVIYTALPLY